MASSNFHGLTRRDDYAWLRAENWQEVLRDPGKLDPRIRAYLDAEHAFQAAQMASTQALQHTLVAEMTSRISPDESSVPQEDGPFAYGVSYNPGDEHPRHFRTPRDGGPRAFYLDGVCEAKDKDYFCFGDVRHSPDHRWLAWSHDDRGSELYTLTIRDLLTAEDLPDTVTDTTGVGIFDAGSEGIFYIRVDGNNRPSKLLFHRRGTPKSDDRLVHEEHDAGFFMDACASRLNDFVFINIHDYQTSEVRLVPANDPLATPRLVAERERGMEYRLTEGGDVFFILTNADGAKDFKIMEAPVGSPGRENWREVVPHVPGRLIHSHIAFRGFLVRVEQENCLPRITVRDRETGEEHAITFGEEAYSLELQPSGEYDSDTIRFSYSSMRTPTHHFEYDMRTRQRKLLKVREVPAGHDPSDYVSRRIFAPAADGELVPLSLLYRSDTALDGSAPCLLYGYGAYGVTCLAEFDTNVLSLVDRGFIYAIAHVRGGKDMGFAWYENGKQSQKANTFTDFIAAARCLVTEGLTRHDRIVIHGESAGGMLVGAVLNMAPEAFAAAIAEVPFVDVLNTMLDETLPLTPTEWFEWGNPIASKEDYLTIASYSPYDNVKAQDYPPLLVTAGLTDPRVTYWEPAKWVAKLRTTKTDSNPVLFRVNMDAGHAGVSGRFCRLKEIAYSYAFALKVTGSA